MRSTGIFLISMFGVNARGVATPNVLVGVLVFFVSSDLSSEMELKERD